MLRAFKHYSSIAFDVRVIFWLQLAQQLPCAYVFAALHAYGIAQCLYSPHTQKMHHMHKHKAVTGGVEAKTLLSRQRQSDYNDYYLAFKKSLFWIVAQNICTV